MACIYFLTCFLLCGPLLVEALNVPIPCPSNTQKDSQVQKLTVNWSRSGGLTCERGRAMAQAVSRRAVTAEAWVRARVNPCGICGGQSGTGDRFFSESSSPLSISFHRRSPNSYHLGDEQYVRSWQQFRDVSLTP
jgi:hypothetical protein